MSLISRRSLLSYAGIASSSILLRRGLSAQAPFDAARTTDVITPGTRQAIERGLAWLGRRQVVSGREEGAFGHGGYSGGVAVGSLGGLAFMMSGNPPGQGPFGKAIDRCIRF